MQDIIPKDKRTIRNIPLEKRPLRPASQYQPPHQSQDVYRPERAIPVPIHTQRTEPKLPASSTPERTSTEYKFDDAEDGEFIHTEERGVKVHRKATKILFGTALVLAILIAVGGYALFYSKAEVTIVPKTQPISANTNVDISSGVSASTSLNFQVLTLSDQEEITVPANGEEKVDVKAKGTITISNDYSEAPQKLIANTRFESKEGKIYRIAEAVTVPGQKRVSGKLVPGTIDVAVTADGTGQSYNTAGTSFTIPGFKGDPRYAKFSAKVKTNIAGGFSGTRKKVAEADVKAKTDEAVARLKSRLADNAKQQASGTAVLIATYFENKEPVQKQSDTSVTFTQSVEAHSIVIDKEALSNLLVEQSGIATGDNKLYINKFSDLTFELVKAPDKPWLASELNFTIKGKADVIWYYNPEKLKEDLAGTSKKDLTLVLSKYDGVQEAEAIVRPFWKTSFPTNVRQITVTEN